MTLREMLSSLWVSSASEAAKPNGKGVKSGRWARAFSWAKSDRKSTRLNSSHLGISYAVFCLKKKIQCVRSVAQNRRRALATPGQRKRAGGADRHPAQRARRPHNPLMAHTRARELKHTLQEHD